MEGESTPTTGTTRNVHVGYEKRYKEHFESLGTGARAQNRMMAIRNKTRRNGQNRTERRGQATQKRTLDRDIERSLEAKSLGLNEELKNKSAKKAPHPSFPFVIFTLAVMKDIIDLLSLTVVGMLLTKPLTLVIAIVLFFWFLGKMSGRWWKGKMVSWLWKRYILAMAVELVGEVVPTTTILVLMAHFRETKTVKIFNAVLESLHSGKIKLDPT